VRTGPGPASRLETAGVNERPTIVPQRAIVTPRAVAPESGDALPLEDLIRPRLAADPEARIFIRGGPGSGKTTALRHLAAVMTGVGPITWIDEPGDEEISGRVVMAGDDGPPDGFAVYELAPWSGDETLEYLLARHPEDCASVMGRLGSTHDRERPGGRPDVLTRVLDAMAGNADLTGWHDALDAVLEVDFQSARGQVAEDCLDDLRFRIEPPKLMDRVLDERRLRALVPPRVKPRSPGVDLPTSHGLLRHEDVRRHLVAEALLERLRTDDLRRASLELWWPREILQAVAPRLAHESDILETLRDVCRRDDEMHRRAQPTAAAILVVADPDWRPDALKDLTFAGLSGAVWPGVDLTGADLRGADLSRADLDGADLSLADAFAADLFGASLRSAVMAGLEGHAIDLRNADLSGADLSESVLSEARLAGADLTGANLSRARLRAADLTDAILEGATLDKALLTEAVLGGARLAGTSLQEADLSGLDLRRADLGNANFARSDLERCRLDGQRLAGVNLSRADLALANLTGADLRGADLTRADLGGARAAEIDLQGADLRGASLHGVIFHHGTSRSGLLDSPYASEGTRTGFYTDDDRELLYENPELIRRANLRGADLRETDFYLVDVREALYDAAQGRLLRRTGAIMS
jgi:uncharacterized protein YjbI with pentapeptide repeats